MSPRLRLAAEAGVLPHVQDQSAFLIGPAPGMDLGVFGDAQVLVHQTLQPDAHVWEQRGAAVTQNTPDTQFDTCIVSLPRSKDAARARIAAAMACSSGFVLVDGQKTDGVESILKDMRKRVEILGTVSKAHGKLFWCHASDAFADWVAQPMVLEDRWHTVPGVFSASAVDAGSRALKEALPSSLSGHVADLGAGWGYLSGSLFAQSDSISHLHLVEADHSALECARRNVSDPRAQFHWADATTWRAPVALDAVVMNPPFHSGRAAEPDLGRAFIASAAQNLRAGGTLWMVANRHLPYERTLSDLFKDVSEIAGTSKFKVLRAQTRSRAGR